MQRTAFDDLHPAITFAFFVAALLLSVIVQNPLWLGASVGAAAVLYLCLRKEQALPLLLALGVAFVAISVINPLFNAQGATVLFSYGGRPYTLEALLLGMETAAMFAAVMLWFGSYARIMTSEKLTCLFGGVAPNVTLVLIMALRLVPNYREKARRITDARACVGLSLKSGSLPSRVADGAAVLSALTSDALEGAVITADAMRARGFGCGPRTQFALFGFGIRDGAFAVVAGVLLGIAGAGIGAGCAWAQFLPQVMVPPLSVLGVVSWVAFVGLLMLPAGLILGERISWRSSLSKI